MGFCAYTHATQDSPDYHHGAFVTTVTVKTRVELKSLRHDPSFFHVKLALYHMLCFPRYVMNDIKLRIINETNILAWGILIPGDAITHKVIHLLWIMVSIFTMMTNQLRLLTLTPQTSQIHKPYQSSPSSRPTIRPTISPLPANLMILSSVMLHMSFVGEMIKRGAQWTPFNDFLTAIGQEGTTKAMALRRRGRKVINYRFHLILCLMMVACVVPTMAVRRRWKDNTMRTQTCRHQMVSPGITNILLGDTQSYRYHQQPLTPLASCNGTTNEGSSNTSFNKAMFNFREPMTLPQCTGQQNEITLRCLHTRDQRPTTSFGPQPAHTHHCSVKRRIRRLLYHWKYKRTCCPCVQRATRPTPSPWTTNLCLVTDVLVLAHHAMDQPSSAAFNFVPTKTEFGTDNCATQHICGTRQLFRTMKEPDFPIGVKGISGISSAKGIGSIAFSIIDDAGKTHDITLDNVIYLPGAVKNLISISQWSRDKNDNCAILSRGSYSIFVWHKDAHTKVIEHSPLCAIPMMPVNEHLDSFALFTTKHKSRFDSTRAITNHNHLLNNSDNEKDLPKEVPKDQQSEVPSLGKPFSNNTPSPGDTVRAWLDGKWVVAIVTKVNELRHDKTSFRIRLLNSRTEATLSAASIRPIPPDPSDFPSSPSEVDATQLTHTLNKEEMRQLWSPSTDDTVSHTSRLTLYWHHRLRCAPLSTLHRLSERGVLPACIKQVKLMPLCASCAFATAHRKGWRTRSSKASHIRKNHQTKPGDGTSYDHIISHQPGLIP